MKSMGSKLSIMSPEEKAPREAIDRVYKKYGTDLSAFFRDAYEELTIKRQESSNAAERRHVH